MASGKRASMREGPLAALFRKTEEEEGPQDEASQSRPERASTPERPSTPGPPAASTEPLPASTERPSGVEERPAPPAEPRAEQPPREEQGRRAATGPETPAARERAERRPGRYEGVPTPEERLRTVFSTDIPENMLDAPPSGRERDEAMEPQPREQPSAAGSHDPVLRVVGVGGAGVNAVDRMIEAAVEGVEFVAINTDLQSLEQSSAQTRVHIGNGATRGLGSGADPDLGRQSALEQYDELKGHLKGADMVFITAGAGGGTGTGAAPVVAQIAREIGALTVGIITKPFTFEGARRGAQADAGIEALAAEVDTLITIPNSRLLSVLDKKTSMVDAFRVADDVLRQGVQGISDLITLPGLINLDFADVRTIMRDAGQALLGIGMGAGETRAMDAATAAVASPLLETSVDGAKSILLSITGGADLSLWEVNEAAKAVSEAAHPEANIIFGAMVDERLDGEIWITVVATGYGEADSHGSDRPGIPDEVDREPRVTRTPQRERATAGATLSDLDVPEFVPRR